MANKNDSALEEQKETIDFGKANGAQKAATIGPSISIHGDVTGEENLIVRGTIEGTINLKENNLVVGENGRITANITARVIRVEGEVKGELRGSEQVIIRPSGVVNGDIKAPRVVLEDGCKFRGSVDMDDDKSIGSANRDAQAPRLRLRSTDAAPTPTTPSDTASTPARSTDTTPTRSADAPPAFKPAGNMGSKFPR